jgi:hypothetical protein
MFSRTYYYITSIQPQTPPHDVKDRDDNGRVFSMRLTEGCAGDAVDMDRRDSDNSSASKNKFMTPPPLLRKESDSREVSNISSL